MTKKRARRTPAEWMAMVSELRSTGVSAGAYAREHGLSLPSLSYWMKKSAKPVPSAPVAPRAKTVFSEVVVVPRARTAPTRIEVVTRGGSAIRLEGGFDAALLRAVLQVVESC